jgi:hypothetical protein
MFIPPIQPNPITFGIYLKTRKTGYGQCDYGVYKNHNIEIYTAKENNKLIHKLFYVSDAVRNFIKSKLIYFENGIKKVVRGNATGSK